MLEQKRWWEKTEENHLSLFKNFWDYTWLIFFCCWRGNPWQITLNQDHHPVHTMEPLKWCNALDHTLSLDSQHVLRGRGWKWESLCQDTKACTHHRDQTWPINCVGALWLFEQQLQYSSVHLLVLNLKCPKKTPNQHTTAIHLESRKILKTSLSWVIHQFGGQPKSPSKTLMYNQMTAT